LSWEWDETLYAGSAPYYARGRLPYPQELAEVLTNELHLDGRGWLLDVGCGPGSLTLLLAPLFAEAVGVDADADMIAEALRRSTRDNVQFIQLRAEDLTGAFGTFYVATFAQSFHWCDQTRVAAAVFELLEPGGAAVHVSATTHQGEGDVPRDQIAKLVCEYLGPVRRAGGGALPDGTPSSEDDAFAGAGFEGPRRVDVHGTQVFERSEDDVVASVFSLSSAAPHLFGKRLSDFEEELRALLRRASPNGRFHERSGEIGLRIWTRS
jgi:SAM-dependent methyltransferase